MAIQLSLRQASLLDLCPITTAVEKLAQAGGNVERGAVFTRREVVDFILDLCGYTIDKPLQTLRLLEPSFGRGDFLLPAVNRLLTRWKTSNDSSSPAMSLRDCIHAVELHRESFDTTYRSLVTLLVDHGIKQHDADTLASNWLVNGDYLLVGLPSKFDFVVGNPPYVRQEMIPAALLAEYRSLYTTIYDRADLYIPFIERSLLALKDKGTLGFICADRWMKNRYGGPLRELVARDFHLSIHVDMSDTPAFMSDVVAYPAITIIRREPAGATRLAFRPSLDPVSLRQLTNELRATSLSNDTTGVREVFGVAAGSEPWIFDSADQLALVRRLERDFPAIEQAGCKVGIGVATGADSAFIGDYTELDVEPDRKLPLAMTRDIQNGVVDWRGFGVINPFDENGRLVNLHQYPRLARHLESRKKEIAGRHCAKKNPANWYRTIDRITPSLANKAKLLVPDIKGAAHFVYEEGRLYPHHNLYYVTSDEWDLRALQAVLQSGIARLFVAAYSTKMRGGFLRFQAQYLRRIRIPKWSDVPEHLRCTLTAAAQSGDSEACSRAIHELYNLSTAEISALEEQV